jgi:hypothetical protein
MKTIEEAVEEIKSRIDHFDEKLTQVADPRTTLEQRVFLEAYSAFGALRNLLHFITEQE